MLGREIGDAPALEEGERAGQDEERVSPLADRVGYSLPEGCGFPSLHGFEGDPQRAGRGLHLGRAGRGLRDVRPPTNALPERSGRG
jgi:hypothetical protein